MIPVCRGESRSETSSVEHVKNKATSRQAMATYVRGTNCRHKYLNRSRLQTAGRSWRPKYPGSPGHVCGAVAVGEIVLGIRLAMDMSTSAPTPADIYGGHRVRVMWERSVGTRGRWPFNLLHKPEPTYVFIGYSQGWAQPPRICLRDDGSAPFIITNPLAYDGGCFIHGPNANANRYDAENDGHTLGRLFNMLLHRIENGDAGLTADERQALERELDVFFAWIWRAGRRERSARPHVRVYG
jgi:hypothetical protein